VAVAYAISWRDPNERLYDIEIAFTAPSDRPRLILPSWRPGRYLMQHFAVNVREWSSNLSKVATSVWEADARAGDNVVVRYRYWAGVLDAGSSFLDSTEAYFNGSNLFMWIDGLREQPATLTIAAPDDWLIETQLTRVGHHHFEARDYDHLIDSPVICAKELHHYTFDDFHIVSIGLDCERFVEPLRKIAKAQIAVFGEFPTNEYRFLIHAGDRWHGVEHESSCSMIVKRNAHDFDDHFLSLAAHELFHVWNVKRIMPASFAPYDYTRETPTRLLWAMEGITSYYGDLSLVRSGVRDVAWYLEHLRTEIETLENNAASRHTSLSQTSFDGWLHDPTRPHEKGNAWYSFYTKGELVAALLDLRLRTRGRSLDEVMRTLWEIRILDEGAVARVADDPEFFARYVDGVDPLPYAEIFAAAGIAFESAPREINFGAKLRHADGGIVIDSLISGGTAMAAGLLQGDEVIAISTNRTKSIREVEALVKEARSIEITYARAGVVHRTQVVPRASGVDIRLAIADADNALRAEWLRRIE
jgi:predicted metalloprotease with PDZ domain